MPAGQPTKYSEAMLAKADEYLYQRGYLNNGKVIPSRIGLALYLDVCPKTIDNWQATGETEGDRPEFLRILTNISSTQHELLINSGLTGDFNASIAKLALGKHGYSDKSENTHQGPDGSPLVLNFQGVPGGSR